MTLAEHIAGQIPLVVRNVHKIFVGNLKGKKQLGRPRRRWEDNNELYFKKIR
jgi:hypothetical protein